jgi:uncharacterized protein with von Willebrand factor type A (vWA) domain
MFDLLIFNLRIQGVNVGLGEWLTFLGGIKRGLVVELEGLYSFGRSVLVQSETQYDAWDLAFDATFQGVRLEPDISEALLSWLGDAERQEGDRVDLDLSFDEMRRRFYERLKEQKERHDGGSHWIGTGGTSPFGSQGRSSNGIRVGPGGGRSALAVAGERRWANYRSDKQLDVRDFQVALRALRKLTKEGQLELDVDGTIRKTADNGGEIDLEFTRARQNKVHLVLLLDTGGSMDAHSRLVSSLFTAANEMKGFKSISTWHFHNVPYGFLYKDFATQHRVPIEEVLGEMSPHHRLVWVGDASMAPWELFGRYHGNPWGTEAEKDEGLNGLGWLQRMKGVCRSSVWLNPDPERFWAHPTVSAIGEIFPMFPLTVDGLRDAVGNLRVPV